MHHDHEQFHGKVVHLSRQNLDRVLVLFFLCPLKIQEQDNLEVEHHIVGYNKAFEYWEITKD